MDGIKAKHEDFGTLVLKNECTTYFARKRGKSHVKNRTVCQDYCLVKNLDSETQVVCVSDGHGGEAYTKSDVGSKLACEVFCDLVENVKNRNPELKTDGAWLTILKTKDFKNEYIQAWKKAVIENYLSEVEECIESESSIVKKYGTTFLFVVYTKGRMVIGQLGDGAILLFNDYEQCQLFKRHELKTSSRTSSLASNRAEYAFIVDIYERTQYSYALLSTDGIYDKLDHDDSFFLYAKSLAMQVNNDKVINNPFHVEDIDVSEISKDDCTIAIMVFDKRAGRYELLNMEEYGFEDILFKRSLPGIEVYEALKEGRQYELHVVRNRAAELDLDLKAGQFIKADFKFPLPNGKIVVTYVIPDSWSCLNELMECGEHLEKRYWFNDKGLLSPEEDEDNQAGVYTNAYWLAVYERMIQMKNELDIANAVFHDYAFECVFVTENKEIVILSDALYHPPKNNANTDFVINHFLGSFSIIGKLSCGNISVALFECASQGQNIVMLHAHSERKPLCRVIFNREKKILGLWNATDSVWNVENEKRKEIPVQGVLRLNRNHAFLIQCDERELAQGAELIDGYAKYQVTIF